MNYILVDLPLHKENLLPLSYFRPISELRIGIDTIKEKWESFLGEKVSFYTDEYLQEKFPVKFASENIYIASHVIPDDSLVKKIKNLSTYTSLFDEDSEIIAYKGNEISRETFSQLERKKTDENIKTPNKIHYPWDLVRLNESQILKDFSRITKNKSSKKLSGTNLIIGSHPVFIEKGVKVEACIFNTENGPIYVGHNTLIMEGSMLRGPLAIMENSVIKMGTKIYGGTTLGPNSKIGGEIKNSIFLGNTNKGHDGYLGDSVIAEWCNLGADTNNSNLKNNYSEVKMWNYPRHDFIPTGMQFMGLIMGDHSKSGISTMFNTGTVVGVSANVFGADFQPKFFLSFKWGNKQEMQDYQFDKALEVAKTVMKRQNKDFDQVEKRLFENIYKLAKQKENI